MQLIWAFILILILFLRNEQNKTKLKEANTLRQQQQMGLLFPRELFDAMSHLCSLLFLFLTEFYIQNNGLWK